MHLKNDAWHNDNERCCQESLTFKGEEFNLRKRKGAEEDGEIKH